MMTIDTRSSILAGMHPNSTTLLVIERHPLMRAAIVSAIAGELDLTIGAIASDATESIQVVEALHPGIILFAIGNPGEEDMKMMQKLHKKFPEPVFLALVTGEVQGQKESALEHGAAAVLVRAAPRAELLHTLRVLKANMEASEENMSHVQRRHLE